jgi:predicted signal transduction protein with EAL and GGDEF domain
MRLQQKSDGAERADCAAIVASIAGLGRDLGLVTTAEGVETETQFEARPRRRGETRRDANVARSSYGALLGRGSRNPSSQ